VNPSPESPENESAAAGLASPAPIPVASVQAPRSNASNIVLWLIAVGALLLGAGSWLTRGIEIDKVAQEAGRKLAEAQSVARDAQAVARVAQDGVRDALAKQSLLEAKLAESQNQQVALERLYEELSRSKDEFAVIEVERMVDLAAQQLQVAGNVNGAIAALQTADARLARADKPQYSGIRRVIARDIEKLKAQPAIDITGLALKLDALVDQIDSLPLLSEPRPLAGSKREVSPNANPSWWSRVSEEVKDEFNQLVRIRQVDSPEALLMSPEQARVFRDGIRLRLMSARLSLLSRNQALLRGDLQRIDQAVNKTCDTKQRSVQTFLAGVKTLSGATVSLDAPSLADSLSAIANARAARQ
jgi:uncharacterized protein HemX